MHMYALCRTSFSHGVNCNILICTLTTGKIFYYGWLLTFLSWLLLVPAESHFEKHDQPKTQEIHLFPTRPNNQESSGFVLAKRSWPWPMFSQILWFACFLTFKRLIFFWSTPKICEEMNSDMFQTLWFCSSSANRLTVVLIYRFIVQSLNVRK